MEKFAKPGAGGIIVKKVNGIDCILVQDRCKEDAVIFESNGYKVLSYIPFNSSQNVAGSYPIMVQVFICEADGELLTESNESKNLRWMPINQIADLLATHPENFYPMHVVTLRKYMQLVLK